MKSRPIIFNGEMVRAILAGRKTQTRRIVKGGYVRCDSWGFREGWFGHLTDGSCEEVWPPCGLPGDRLWVRETWAYNSQLGVPSHDARVVYRATEPDWETMEGWKWRHSIHMPRWASRITLEITGVRVERVQSISADDAKSEGVSSNRDFYFDYLHERFERTCAVGSFESLWESIHGKGAWEENPWVWVYEFRRVKNK